MNDYRVGSVIEYQPFGGDTRTIIVEEKHNNIKNGRPGFDGIIIEGGMSIWGYNSQIIMVVTY